MHQEGALAVGTVAQVVDYHSYNERDSFNSSPWHVYSGRTVQLLIVFVLSFAFFFFCQSMSMPPPKTGRRAAQPVAQEVSTPRIVSDAQAAAPSFPTWLEGSQPPASAALPQPPPVAAAVSSKPETAPSFIEDPSPSSEPKHHPTELVDPTVEEERSLLSELFALEDELSRMQRTVRDGETKYQTELMVAETERAQKQLVLSELEFELSHKRKQLDEHSQQHRLHVIKSHEADLLELPSEVERLNGDRWSRQERLLDAEVHVAAAAVEKAEKDRALLLLNGTFTTEGIYAQLESETTLEEKMAKAITIIEVFVERSRAALLRDICQKLRGLTVEVSHEVARVRAAELAAEASDRQHTFAKFLDASLTTAMKFLEERAKRRFDSVQNYRNELKHGMEGLRAEARKRIARGQQTLTDVFAQHTTKALQQRSEATRLLDLRFDSDVQFDASVFCNQEKDVMHRLDANVAVLKQLQSAEIDHAKERSHAFKALNAEAVGRSEVIAELRRSFGAMSEDMFSRLKQLQLNTESEIQETARQTSVRLDTCRHETLSQLVSTLIVESDRLAVDHSRTCEVLTATVDAVEGRALELRDHWLTVHQLTERSQQKRTIWEKEHRDMLSKGCNEGHDYDIHFLALQTVGDKIKSNIAVVLERFQSQRRDLRKLEDARNSESREMWSQVEQLQDEWVKLYEKLLEAISTSNAVGQQHVAVGAEAAKRELEVSTLQAERAAIEEHSRLLHEQRSLLEAESVKADQQRRIAESTLRALQDEMEVLTKEQMKLAGFQSDVQHRFKEIVYQEFEHAAAPQTRVGF